MIEKLPNEIFMEIFQYFDARDIFRAFYDLNTRFNILLESLNNLSIKITMFNVRKIIRSRINPHCIQTMLLNCQADIDLNNYENLRYLKLSNPTLKQLDKLESANLLYLKYFCIDSEFHSRICLDIFDRYNRGYKIFSNGFPNLKSCFLFNIDVILIVSNIIQSIKLKFLTVGCISFKTYQAILLTCPNLHFLRFSFPRFGGKPLIMKSHFNLRRMIINIANDTNPSYEYDINDYFSCVPNLEQLSIIGGKTNSEISSYLNCNWFARSIEHHLLLLRRFEYRLSIYLKENEDINIRDRLEASFNRAHNYRYQSKLIFEF